MRTDIIEEKYNNNIVTKNLRNSQDRDNIKVREQERSQEYINIRNGNRMVRMENGKNATLLSTARMAST